MFIALTPNGGALQRSAMCLVGSCYIPLLRSGGNLDMRAINMLLLRSKNLSAGGSSSR